MRINGLIRPSLHQQKKATEARLAAYENEEIDDQNEDIFELQHHHLLSCLEKTTVSAGPLGLHIV